MLDAEKENIQKVYSFCKNYYHNNQIFPPLNEIVKNTSIDRRTITAYLRVLIANKYMKMVNNRYYLTEQKVRKYPKKKKEEKPEEKEVDVKKVKKVIINRIFIFKIIIGVVFLAFLYMGIKYNYSAFILSKSKLDALMSAIGFFIFGIISFECFIIFLFKKKAFCWLFLILFLIIFTNNFINILSGQFEKYQTILFSEEKIQIDRDKILYQEYNKQEKELEIELNNRITDREIYNKKLLEDPENKTLKQSKWYITNRHIPRLQKELKEVRTKKEKILKETEITKTEKMTIYDFISNIFKLKANNIQFIHLIFPAFILDIISSISLALLFFMKEE